MDHPPAALAEPATDRPRAPQRILAHWRRDGPWTLRDTLRAFLVVTLMAVSAYYLTRLALAVKMPWQLAWTLCAALDVAGLVAILVLERPRDDRARRSALQLAVGAAGLSVAGNGAMHAVDWDVLKLEGTAGLVAAMLVGGVYPAMLGWSLHVANGMAPRPVRSEASTQREVPSTVVRPATRRTRRVAPEPGPAVVLTPPSAPAAGPAPQAEPVTEELPQVEEAPAAEVAELEAPAAEARTYDQAVLVEWALEHRQPNGKVAGWKAIRSAHPGLTEHYAKDAWQRARAAAAGDDEPAELLSVVGGE